MTPTRRQFIQSTAALSAATAMGVHTSHAAQAKSTVNFALVGLGSLSTNQIAPALQETEFAKLKGIVTGTRAKEANWADQYGINRRDICNYDNFDKLAENESIDVIYVVLPSSMHKEFTIRAAKAGKHVLCEKPMANSSQDCREMIQACRFLTGEEPLAVTAQETKTDPVKFAGVDETITWTMTMPSGVNCYCSTSYAFNGISRFNAYGDNGSFGLDHAYSYQGIKGTSKDGPIELDQIDQFAAEMDSFARCVLDDRTSKVSGEE